MSDDAKSGFAQQPSHEMQDTYLVGGPPDLKAMSGSIESDRVIQLHFRRKATDEDRKWLLDAINMKLASDAALAPGNGAVESVSDDALCAEVERRGFILQPAPLPDRVAEVKT